MAIPVPKDVMIVGSELVLVWEDGREDYISVAPRCARPLRPFGRTGERLARMRARPLA